MEDDKIWFKNIKDKIKKAEHRRTDAFKLWYQKKLLSVPWTARRSNQSILKEIHLNIHWKDWCWNWKSNTLTTWSESALIGKGNISGKDWGQEEKGPAGDKWLDSIIDSMDMNLSKLPKIVKEREA